MLVASIKIIYGWKTGILSITSDGYDSFFDGIANIVGIFAITIASRPANEKRQYGYSKVETFSAIIISFLLFMTGYAVLSDAIGRFYGMGVPSVSIESFLILGFTLMINVPIAIYEKRKGEELKSPILISDSKHTLTDVYVTIAVLIGLVFISLGYTIVDPILSVIIAIIIINTGISILLDNIRVLLDSNVLDNDAVEKCVMSIDGVEGTTNIRSRGTRSTVFLDLHLILNPDITVNEAETIKNDCKLKLTKEFGEIEDILIEIDTSS